MASKIGLSVLRAAVASSFFASASCDVKETSEIKPDSTHHTVAVYLTPESQNITKRNLAKLGVKGDIDAKYVVIRRNCSAKDSYPFEPLFGERAAFRLKAIARTEDGTVAGTGRVGMLNGELRDDDYEVSLPVTVKPKDDGADHPLKSDSFAIDLPTRIANAQVVGDKPFWRGRVVGGNVHGTHYPAVKGSFVNIEKERQFVVDGYLCRSDFVDEQGNCVFDRAVHMSPSLGDVHGGKRPSEQKQSSANASTSTSTKAKTQSSPGALPSKEEGEKKKKSEGGVAVEEKEDEDECPVCRYMKAGPCREAFLEWDGCIQALKPDDDMGKCFEVTMNMMSCMRDHEYYDMMTAGTGDKYDAAQQVTDAGVTKEHAEGNKKKPTKQ